jgi:hypothetical protein
VAVETAQKLDILPAWYWNCGETVPIIKNIYILYKKDFSQKD